MTERQPGDSAASGGPPVGMDDERWEPGMPVLDRQQVGEAPSPTPRPAGVPRQGAVGGSLPPRSVPEARPTPLQGSYVYLSAVVLVLGFIAITALEIGTPPGSPLIKVCVLVSAPILIVTTLDAIVRIWRSAWTWMPVNRGRGLFRLAWVVVAVIGLAALVAAAIALILA